MQLNSTVMIVVVVLALLALYQLWSALCTRRLLPIEQSIFPTFTFHVGGRIGRSLYLPNTLGLRVYESFLVVSSCRHAFMLPYDQIDRVETLKFLGLIPYGLRIVHHQRGVPATIRLMGALYFKSWLDAKLTAMAGPLRMAVGR